MIAQVLCSVTLPLPISFFLFALWQLVNCKTVEEMKERCIGQCAEARQRDMEQVNFIFQGQPIGLARRLPKHRFFFRSSSLSTFLSFFVLLNKVTVARALLLRAHSPMCAYKLSGFVEIFFFPILFSLSNFDFSFFPYHSFVIFFPVKIVCSFLLSSLELSPFNTCRLRLHCSSGCASF